MASGDVSTGSVAGLDTQTIRMAVTEYCAARGSVAVAKSHTRQDCRIDGERVSFELSGSQPATTLNVISLDARTSLRRLQDHRDAVLRTLSIQ